MKPEIRKRLETWVSKDQYIQHNLSFANGREGLIEGIKQMKGANTQVDIQRIIQDGDYVAVHYKETDDGKPSVLFDIFRFDKNGKIVEHWDNSQELAPANPSGTVR